MGEALENVRTSIAHAIEEARQDAHMTQAQLAEAVGVNASTVGRWERQEDPTPPGFDTAVIVARALRVSLDQLAFGREPFFERVVEETIRRLDQRKGPQERAGGPA